MQDDIISSDSRKSEWPNSMKIQDRFLRVANLAKFIGPPLLRHKSNYRLLPFYRTCGTLLVLGHPRSLERARELFQYGDKRPGKKTCREYHQSSLQQGRPRNGESIRQWLHWRCSAGCEQRRWQKYKLSLLLKSAAALATIWVLCRWAAWTEQEVMQTKF